MGILEENCIDTSCLVDDSIIGLRNDFQTYNYPDKDSQAFRDEFLQGLKKMDSSKNVILTIKYRSLVFFLCVCFFWHCVKYNGFFTIKT